MPFALSTANGRLKSISSGNGPFVSNRSPSLFRLQSEVGTYPAILVSLPAAPHSVP
jgi:hypothetical protein